MKVDMEKYHYEDEVEATENDLKGMARLLMLLTGVAVSIFLAIVAFV